MVAAQEKPAQALPAGDVVAGAAADDEVAASSHPALHLA